ncbi:unnamed protein product [Phytophthora fragariaefolia]|uniref:Unnamed protein product n=1 Tax=Phytophthora fragariaefolia TaxID=1490495 RepID=A0A9W6XGM7_9STRA|nr:unnamed protein product [Phytophthora fragariaefolia]
MLRCRTGCLELALRVKKCPLWLVDGGCKVLRAVLAFPIRIASEAEDRWIAVATSLLQRSSTQQQTRELLFATTLAVLSRGNQLVKTAKGQHIKLINVILDGLEDSIQHESDCTLLPGECDGAIRLLEEITKVSDYMSDTLVSKCLCVLGKIISIFILSPSATVQEIITRFDNLVVRFTTARYVDKLIARLEKCVAQVGVIRSVIMNFADDFRALEAILLSSQGKKALDVYQRVFGYIVAVVENINAHEDALGDYTPFFLKLGCLTSQLLSTTQRRSVITAALDYVTEENSWYSMRWVATLADCGSNELAVVVEFVLGRIIFGITVLEPALLMEFLDTLNYFLRCSQSRDMVFISSHANELQDVLWRLVRTDVAHLEAEFDDHDIAEEVLQATSSILQHCIKLGAEHVRTITQHRATRQAVAESASAVSTKRQPCQSWCVVVLGAVIRYHGLLYAEKILLISQDPFVLLVGLIDNIIQNLNVLSWNSFLDCVGMVASTSDLQSDLHTLLGRLQQQCKSLIFDQTTVANARRVKKHIAKSIAYLTLRHARIQAATTVVETNCTISKIVESGLAFYELFNTASSFDVLEYSVIATLHLQIASCVANDFVTEKPEEKEPVVIMRRLLDPLCVSNEVIAAYVDLAVATVLCAPSQYNVIVQLALEISCCIAGYRVNLTHESTKIALQLLFVYVQTSNNSSRACLASLVLEYFLALESSAHTMPLVQHCRSRIIPATANSVEDKEMFIQQLYIVRQKLISPVRSVLVDSSGAISNISDLHAPRCEAAILNIITSNCRSIVQVTSEFYVDMNTSEKITTEPFTYSALREAVTQLSIVLENPDVGMSRGYLSNLVPALCEILALHPITTPMVCTAMQILEQITFVTPSIVLSNKQLDLSALLASFSLHQRFSLLFAQHLTRFCNSIGSEIRATDQTRLEQLNALVHLLLELLQKWKMEFEIVDECLSTIQCITNSTDICSVGLDDQLELLNSSIQPYISNSLTSWNWLNSVLKIVSECDKLDNESTGAAVSIALSIIRMFMCHGFMVEKATMMLSCIYRKKQHLPLQHLIEFDIVKVLLTCLQLHANEECIGYHCQELLMSLTGQNDKSLPVINQLSILEAATPLLLACKNSTDKVIICTMCCELLRRMLETFDIYPNPQVHTIASTLRKKSEFLTILLEAEIIPLLFDLLDSYSCQGTRSTLEPYLALLKSLTKDEGLCESAEMLHGLQELQQTLIRILENNEDFALVELVIDCLINMASCDRVIGHGWRELAIWLLDLAASIHNIESKSTELCVEKLIGILGRLAVDSAICKAIAPKGSFTILELLQRVGEFRSLERALYGLLCMLSEDAAAAQVLIVYKAIPITTKRINCHIDDEETLLNSLCFFDLLVLNSGECYPALQDNCVFETLRSVIQKYPETAGTQIYGIANTILDKVSALDYQKQHVQADQDKPSISKSQLQVPDSEKVFY